MTEVKSYIPFTGKNQDFYKWSRKFLAQAKLVGYQEILKGTTTIPDPKKTNLSDIDKAVFEHDWLMPGETHNDLRVRILREKKMRRKPPSWWFRSLHCKRVWRGKVTQRQLDYALACVSRTKVDKSVRNSHRTRFAGRGA